MLNLRPDEEMALVIASGNAARVGELLEWGVKANARSEDESFLALACKHGHAQIANLLIKAGADITRRDLLRAVLGGNYRICDRIADELVFKGMSLDLWEADSPVWFHKGFYKSTNVDMLKWLKRQGADLTLTDNYGRTPLERARIEGSSPEVEAFLASL